MQEEEKETREEKSLSKGKNRWRKNCNREGERMRHGKRERRRSDRKKEEKVRKKKVEPEQQKWTGR